MTLPTLMLLPGLNCDAEVWQSQIEALQHQVNGHVPAWGLRDSLHNMAEQVLQEAPTERFNLAGHSMGGRVALQVMRLAPQRVLRLALLSTGTHPLPEGAAGQKERQGRMDLLQIARAQGMRAMAQSWARGMVHPDRLDTPLYEAVLAMLERGSAEQFAAQIKALLNRPDAADLLPAIACPTLVLTGREDSWAGPAQHETMAAAIPGATLTIVEHCGHMCTMEQPEAISQALAQWLAQPG